MLPLGIRKVQSSAPNEHLLTIGEDLKPEGEGSFKNGPNYLVDSPSQNDLGSFNHQATDGKSKAASQVANRRAKAPANDYSGD